MSEKYPTLGEKIRMFRKRTGMSQSSLELEIDASFGSLSRIENDQTNPTKETLMKIAKVLNLREDEISYLFQVRDPEITDEDIEEIIKVSEKLFEDIKVPAYVCDYRMRIWNANRICKKLLNINVDQVEELRGVSIVELLFDEHFPFYRLVDDSKRDKMQRQQVLKIKRLLSLYVNEDWFSDLNQQLQLYPVYRKLWEDTDLTTQEDLVLGRGVVYLNIDDQTLEFTINQSSIYSDPRFSLIEYYPSNQKSMKLITYD